MAPVAWLALVFALVLAAACSGGGGQTASETPAGVSSAGQAFPAQSVDPSGRVTWNVTINTDSLSFSPHQVHANAGDLIAVILVGSAEQHSFTIDAVEVDEELKPNTTRTVRFTVPTVGITPFYCRFHGSESSGMHGLVILH
jgi:plastocyanin